MAGDWLKIEAKTPDKPEITGISDKLGIPKAHVFGCLFLVWRWFDQQTIDGNAPYVTANSIDGIVSLSGFADAMVMVGWLTVSASGVSLPNFERHNGETAKQRGLTAKRVATYKANSGNGKVTQDALPREEKRRYKVKSIVEQAPPKNRLNGHEKPNWSEIVRQAFGYWQEKLGHPHAILDAKRGRVIAARLKDGYSLETLKAAIDGCAASDFHMGRDAKAGGRVNDDIELICRDAKHVEQFVQFAQQGRLGDGDAWV